MRIKKTYQGAVPLNRISNNKNDSHLNTYSTEYLNAQLDGINSNIETVQSNIETINAKLPKVVACNYNDWQTAQTITDKDVYTTITGFDTNITTNGGNILVSMTIPMEKTGGTCWLCIFIDGTKMIQYGISGSGGILAYTNVFPVAPGTHRVNAGIHLNNVETVTIYNYTSRAFTVAEI